MMKLSLFPRSVALLALSIFTSGCLWKTADAKRTYVRPDYGGGGPCIDDDGNECCYQPFCVGGDLLQCQMDLCFGGSIDIGDGLDVMDCMRLQYCTYEAQEGVTLNCKADDPFGTLDDSNPGSLDYLCGLDGTFVGPTGSSVSDEPYVFNCDALFYANSGPTVAGFSNYECSKSTENGVVCTCKEGADCTVKPKCDCVNSEIYCDCNAAICPTGGGDPHFKTWSGHWFDYHGACELVLLQAPNFANGVGLDIYIRTKLQYAYSFIESAALRIGDDILEVTSYGQYYLNSVSNAELPVVIAEGTVTVTHIMHSEKQHEFNLQLKDGQIIQVKTFKNLVSVDFVGRMNFDHFEGSVGLLGAPKTGDMLARDGVTLMNDSPNEFGAEWQVRHDEPKLFLSQVGPQHPQACQLPGPKQESRRLGETVARGAAEKACAHWDNDRKDMCIFDVLQTGDLEVAQSL